MFLYGRENVLPVHPDGEGAFSLPALSVISRRSLYAIKPTFPEAIVSPRRPAQFPRQGARLVIAEDIRTNNLASNRINGSVGCVDEFLAGEVIEYLKNDMAGSGNGIFIEQSHSCVRHLYFFFVYEYFYTEYIV